MNKSIVFQAFYKISKSKRKFPSDYFMENVLHKKEKLFAEKVTRYHRANKLTNKTISFYAN